MVKPALEFSINRLTTSNYQTFLGGGGGGGGGEADFVVPLTSMHHLALAQWAYLSFE